MRRSVLIIIIKKKCINNRYWFCQ